MPEKSKTGWTVRELSRQTGIPISTIASWVSSELVKADHLGRGRGGHTIGISGLLEILAINELRHMGASTQIIRRAVKELRKQTGHQRPLKHLNLVVSGNDILWKDILDAQEMTFSTLRQPGQRLMVFPVGHQCETLADHMAKAGAESSTSTSSKQVTQKRSAPNRRANAAI